MASSKKTNCFSILWSIDHIAFSPFTPKKMLCSPYFRIESLGAEWRMIVVTMKEGYLGLYLHRKPDGTGLPTVTVDFEMTMDSLYPGMCLLRAARNVCFKKDDYWGYPCFVRLDCVRMVASSFRSFAIRCDLSPSDDHGLNVAKDSRLDLKTMSGDFKRLFDEQKLFDLVLKSGRDEFKVLKAVLAARSSRFFKHLKLDETDEGRVPVKDVSFISSPVLKILLSYLYTGELGVPVSEIPHELLMVAEQFELPDLVKKTYSFPNAYLAKTVFNVVHKSILWDIRKISELESKTLFFVRIIPTPSLYIKHLGMRCQVVSDDRGSIKRINAVFHLAGLKTDYPVFVRCNVSGSEEKGKFHDFLKKDHLFEFDKEWHLTIHGNNYDSSLPSVTRIDFQFDLCDGVTFSSVKCDWTNCIECLPGYNNFEQLSHDFKVFQRREIFCDVLVVCAGKTFKAHQSILVARSPVFDKMFEHNFIEKQNGVVRVSDVRPEVMELLLSYIYGGKVDNLEYDDARDLYEAADKYEMIVLKEKCAAILLEKMSSVNAREVLFLADAHFDSELKGKVGSFLKWMNSTALELGSEMEASEPIVNPIDDDGYFV